MIKVLTEPDNTKVHSVDNFLIYETSSDDADIVRMKAELVMDTTAGVSIIHDPKLNFTDRFEFDMHSFASDKFDLSLYEDHLKTSTAGAVVDTPDVLKQMKINFYELTQPATTIIESTTATASDTIDVLVAPYQHEDDQDLDDFTMDSLADNTDRFLTNKPLTRDIQSTEKEQLGFITTFGTVRLFRENYANGSFVSDTTGGNITITDKRGIITMSPSLIPAGIDEVRLTLYPGSAEIFSNLKMSETVIFKVRDYTCYDTTRFHFMNRLGDFDSYTAIGTHEEGLQVTKEDYHIAKASGFAKKDRGMADIPISAFEKFSVVTENLSRANLRWLMEIYNSPLVFIEPSTDVFIPIVITNRRANINLDSPQQLQIDYIKSNDLIIPTL